MIWKQRRLATGTALLVMAVAAIRVLASADNARHVINNPGGGEIVYMLSNDKTTLPDAMYSVLHEVHGYFGERPQIGRFFQTKGSNSVATFFTVTDKKRNDKHVAGLAIVSALDDKQTFSAVIYDEAGHFPISANPMLKRLNEVWQPMSKTTAPARRAAPTGEEVHREAPTQPLHRASIPDDSATISLPSGWQVLPSSGAGAVHAVGPNGEYVNLGVLFQGIYDTRNPRARGMIQYLELGHNPYIICQYGGDLVNAYKSVIQQYRRNQHLPAASIEVLNAQPTQGNQYETVAVLILARLDTHDGKGPMIASIRAGAMKLGPQGQWAMAVNGVGVPDKMAEEEWPTMRAIVKSYAQNGRVIQHQTDVIIAEINRSAQAARDRAKIVSDSNDRRNAAIDQTRDDQSRNSKVFQNYQFDRTVVQDNETGEHGTIGYRFADTLVKSDPNRYEYVQPSEFVLGKDY